MKLIILFAAVIAIVYAAPGHGKTNIPSADVLRNLLAKYTVAKFDGTTDGDSSVANPASCFPYYMPLLDQIATETSDANTECQKQADTALDAATSQSTTDLGNINTEFDNFVAIFKSCSSDTDPINGLNCYADNGNANIPTFTNIIIDARSAVRNYNQLVSDINTEKGVCYAIVSDQSQIASETLYTKLMLCLSNGIIEDYTVPAISGVNGSDNGSSGSDSGSDSGSSGSDNGSDSGSSGSDNGTDNGSNSGSSGSDNGSDSGSSGSDNGSDNGSDSGSSGSDNGTDNGSDSGSSGSDNGTDSGSSGSDNGTDNGSSGSDNGTNNGSDSGSSGSDNGADNGSDNGTDNGSSGSDNGSSGSDNANPSNPEQTVDVTPPVFQV